MRIWSYVLPFFAIVGICAAPAVSFGQAQVDPKLRISARLLVPKKEFKVGEPIRVELRISNEGNAPILIPNTVSPSSGAMSRLAIKVTDIRGNVSPEIQMIVDYLPEKLSDDNAAGKLLSSWVLLYPTTSMLFDISIDKICSSLNRANIDFPRTTRREEFRLEEIDLASAMMSSSLFPIRHGAAKSQQT